MFTEPFRITVNGHHELEILPDDAKNLDLMPDGVGRFHLLHNDLSWHAELVEADYPARHYIIKINGSTYSVRISDHYERLVQQLGLNIGSNQKVNVLKAPMPGLVLNILATPGQEVQKGEPLIILEAMKMENVIKAAGEGRVKALHVKHGDAVEKGQLLVEME